MFDTWETALARLHPKASENYRKGYRDGWLDRYLGHRFETMLNWPEIEFAMGYDDGHRENTQSL